jgi:hypothetical protein
MSLLAQLTHDPPALDLGGPSHVLHLFQCQDPGCLSMDPGMGNDAVMVPVEELGDGLTLLPESEELGGCDAIMINGLVPSDLRLLVGELWIDGWLEHEDGFEAALAMNVFDYDKWMRLPDSVMDRMFECRWRTKMGGIPYWTANGPPEPPPPGYEYFFQLDSLIHFTGKAPTPDECGGRVTVIVQQRKGDALREVRQDYLQPTAGKNKQNAPWQIIVETHDTGGFGVEITNFGSDGTAYGFINRQAKPANVFWVWRR